MVKGVNGVIGTQTTASVSSTTQSQKPKKVKDIPMVDTSKLTPQQKEAVENLKKQIAAGHVEYNDTNVLKDIINFFFDYKSGDYIIIRGFADPKKKLTLGDAKQILKLNLPPGSLRCNKSEGGGGDFDSYNVPKSNGQYYLDIFIDDLEIATGLSKEDIKKLCGAK